MADRPQNMAELHDRIERHRERLLDYVERYPEASMVEVRGRTGWSTKDHLAHLTAWERSIGFLLHKCPRHEGLGVSRDTYLSHDVDRINDEIYRQRRTWNLDKVLQDFDHTHAFLVEVLDELAWKDLQRNYSHYAPDEPGEDSGAPVADWVARNTYRHYDEHLTWIKQLLEPDSTKLEE